MKKTESVKSREEAYYDGEPTKSIRALLEKKDRFAVAFVRHQPDNLSLSREKTETTSDRMMMFQPIEPPMRLPCSRLICPPGSHHINSR